MATSNPKTSRFASFGVLWSSKKNIQPPSSIVEETSHHTPGMIGLDRGENHGFGAGENDWLGAEAYVDPVR